MAHPGLATVPHEIILEIADHILSSSSSGSGATALANLALTCRSLQNVVEPILYSRDVRRKAYSVYWACMKNNTGTLRKAIAAGADPTVQWIFARNGSAMELIADDELVGDNGTMEFIDDDDEDDEGKLDSQDWSHGEHGEEHGDDDDEQAGSEDEPENWIPLDPAEWGAPNTGDPDLAQVYTRSQLCLATGALGRMLYSIQENKLAAAAPDPDDRDVFREAFGKTHGLYFEMAAAYFYTCSPLYLAAWHGHTDVVAMLRDQPGIHVNEANCPS